LFSSGIRDRPESTFADGRAINLCINAHEAHALQATIGRILAKKLTDPAFRPSHSSMAGRCRQRETT
jgi:hypothetical protein